MQMLTRCTKISFCLRNPRLALLYFYTTSVTLYHSFRDHTSLTNGTIRIYECRFTVLTSFPVRLTVILFRFTSLRTVIYACRCKVICTFRVMTVPCRFFRAEVWLKWSRIRDESLRPLRPPNPVRQFSCLV